MSEPIAVAVSSVGVKVADDNLSGASQLSDSCVISGSINDGREDTERYVCVFYPLALMGKPL